MWTPLKYFYIYVTNHFFQIKKKNFRMRICHLKRQKRPLCPLGGKDFLRRKGGIGLSRAIIVTRCTWEDAVGDSSAWAGSTDNWVARGVLLSQEGDAKFLHWMTWLGRLVRVGLWDSDVLLKVFALLYGIRFFSFHLNWIIFHNI